MAESLIDLENVLRSKQGKLSTQEANFLMNWKESTLRQLTVGACAGGAIAWSATGSLSRMLRINLAGGAATIAATWRFRSSVNSCIEQILCMDGSRMQKELANIMLKRYPNYPLTTKLISKRFYCENVFDDTTSDIPKSRWRFRNNFVESAAHPQQRTENHESYDHDAKTGPERKPVPINNAFVAMENPFDCVFGLPTKVSDMGVFTDHYIILGLPSGKKGTKVSMDEIKQAYRIKALELHPDKRGDDPNAVAEFQQLQASYEILKDEETRKAFDDDLIRRLKHQELEKERKQRRIQGRLNMARGIKRINRINEALKE
ncbi:hypothetical protein CTI12_AA235850 [Artemisia annua]|uniref:J domain-containing protein n=1 Tax=Artemisia annua TaxID=35608 RepID=A0A2U1NS19_ARTAN|nr:hypothetical protein CTI12_AA235850 [Artemisia annua]